MGLFRLPNVEKLKAKGDVAGLKKALGHDKTRGDAFLALESLGGGAAIAALADSLNDILPDHRHRATLALATLIEDRRAQDALINVCGEESAEVSAVAAAALQRVGIVYGVSPARTLRRYDGRLIEFGLVERENSSNRFGIHTLTPDGLLFADAMLGDRDCPDHPDVLDDLKAVSRGRVIMLNGEELTALATVALGWRFTNRVIGCASAMQLYNEIDGALLRLAGAMAHAVRHDPGGWALPAPLVEAGFDREAARVLERQLSAGDPPQEAQALMQTALDSWRADRQE